MKVCGILVLALAAGTIVTRAEQSVQIRSTFSSIKGGKTNVISQPTLLTKPGQDAVLTIGKTSYEFRTRLVGTNEIITDARIFEIGKRGKTNFLMSPRLRSLSGQDCTIRIGDEKSAYRFALTATILENENK